MGTWISIIGSIFLVVLGCQSTPLPSVLMTATVNSRWLKDYRQAQNFAAANPEESCRIYLKLSEDGNFPLRSLAGVHAREVCAPDRFGALDRSTLPVYLKDLALEIEWRQAVAQKDEARQIDLALEKSKLKLPQKEKVQWVQLALDKAKELNQDAKVPELQARLYKLAPRLEPDPKMENWPDVAQDFRVARKFALADNYYEKVIASNKFSLDDRISCYKGLRLSYKNARRNKEHIEVSQRYVKFLTPIWKKNKKVTKITTALYDAQIQLARALWTAGDAKAAEDVLNEVEKHMKTRVSMAELYWIRARLAEEKGQPAEITRWLSAALKQKISNPDLRDKISWYAAWNARQQKLLPQATVLFLGLSEVTKSDTLMARALYWAGRCQADQELADQAKTTFESLSAKDPLGYYGMLAHKQLGIAITLPQSPVTPPPLSAALDSNLADWLFWTQEKDVLTAYLDSVSAAYSKDPKQDEDVWTEIFKHYAKAGLYVKLYESLGHIDGERRKAILEHHPELLFPQPWTEEVRTASLQFGVDEEFIYAIMRQESAFDTRARSGADAFGLMQVLPEVGEQMAKQNKIPYADMDDLYDPKTNISVGAAHIKELMHRHRGQFILAVASYNASENAIRNWMKSRFRGDALEFIEEIPFEETRTYVRLVMRNMIFYRLLKSQSASITFPDWVLKLDNT